MSNIQQEDQDFNAERILLSLILILPETIPELTRLSHDHFYYDDYRQIFRSIEILVDTGQDITAVSIMDIVRSKVDTTQLKAVGDVLNILYLNINPRETAIYSLSGLESIIIRDWTIREINRYSQLLVSVSSGDQRDIEGISRYIHKLNELESSLTNTSKNPLVHVKEATEAFIEDYTTLHKRPAIMPTGIDYLDHFLGGGGENDTVLSKGGLPLFTVLLARPGAGKTTLALAFVMNIVRNFKNQSGLGVVVFSLEIGMKHLTAKILSNYCGVNISHILNKNLGQEDWEKIKNSPSEMEGLNLRLCTDSNLTGEDIKRIIAPIREEIGMIVIDYAGLMKDPFEQENPYLGLNENLKSLKSISDDWGISILLLSQAVGTKEGSKEPPRKAAGTMELSRKAELIIGIHKDEVYPDTLQFAILKNRYGPVDDSYRTRLWINWAIGQFFAPNESPVFNPDLKQVNDDNDDITDF